MITLAAIPRQLASLFTCFAVAHAASAQPLSFARTDYPSAPGPRAIASADFNRDGAIDLALADNGDKGVTILLNFTGAGRGFVSNQRIPLGGGPFDIAAADLNNDSIIDLVVANADLSSIDVLLGESDGTFGAPLQVAVPGYPRGAAIADLNYDGKLDVVFTQFTTNSVGILHGDGTGRAFTLAAASPATGHSPQGIVVQDLNHDGYRDIAVANTGASGLSLLYGRPDRGFTHVQVPGAQQLNVLTVADFNRDGWSDIAAASTASSAVALYAGRQTGLSYYGTIGTGASPRGIAAADLNKDGRLDFVTANRGANAVTIVLGRADAGLSFDAPTSVTAGAGSRAVTVADFNQDGQADIATANEYGHSATILTNSSRPAPGVFWRAFHLPSSQIGGTFVTTADFNRNGQIDIVRRDGVILDGQTFVPLTASDRTFATAVTGDFNQDGNADVVMLSNIWSRSISTADVFYGDGSGQFQHGGSFGQLPSYIYAMHAADVNLDGHLDVLVSAFATPRRQIHVLLGGATGFAVGPVFETTLSTEEFAIGDLNRDGKPDLVVVHGYPTSGASVAFGDGTGSFTMTRLLTTSLDRRDVRIGDVNKDGSPDIVAGGPSYIAVWLGSPDGEFPDHALTSGNAGTSDGMLLADFNGDGLLDVLSPASGVRAGRGDGTFGEGVALNIGWSDAEAVDYDRDGRMDVVMADWYRVLILLNRAERGPNLPPVVLTGSPHTLGYGSQFEQEGSGGTDSGSYDPNLDPLVYEWTDSQGKIISTEQWFSWWPALPPGDYSFRLTLRDGHGGESSGSWDVTITPMKESVRHLGWARTFGAWHNVEDSSAAGGARTSHPNAGAPKITTALANPTNYIEVGFVADPTQYYKVWLRLRAENDDWANDSVYLQFEGGAVTADGATRFAVGTTDALDVNLERCSGCGLSGWGWRDERWGDRLTAAPVLLRFPSGGWQRLRVQTREDGVSVDQFVLSAEQYLQNAPGSAKNDMTILTPRPNDD